MLSDRVGDYRFVAANDRQGYECNPVSYYMECNRLLRLFVFKTKGDSGLSYADVVKSFGF